MGRWGFTDGIEIYDSYESYANIGDGIPRGGQTFKYQVDRKWHTNVVPGFVCNLVKLDTRGGGGFSTRRTRMYGSSR